MYFVAFLVYFMVTWYMFPHFGMLYQANLATLINLIPNLEDFLKIYVTIFVVNQFGVEVSNSLAKYISKYRLCTKKTVLFTSGLGFYKPVVFVESARTTRARLFGATKLMFL
jgi:hypothetical protein